MTAPWTNRVSLVVLLSLASSLGNGNCCLAADEADLVRQRLRQQEQAQAITEELIAGVLETQLRQLAENGMQSSAVYRDVQAMHGQLAALAQREMPAIVEMLAAAQSAPPATRQSSMNQAREKIRDVVVQLVAERQRLYRRMQAAHLSVEARQLAEMLSKIHKATRSLSERQAQPTEQLALAAVEDQADINKLYYQLTASLNDVSTWNGPVAAAAANGLRVLRVTHVEQQLKDAAAGLGESEFAKAADNQQLAIRGLAALIEKLEAAEGNSDADRQAGIELVRELILRQSVLRDATRVTEIRESSLEGLIERQTKVHKDVGELTKALAAFVATASLVEQAKTAAFDATASLFESKINEAMSQQANVVSNLAQLESVLRRSGEGSDRDLSAAELAEYVARLEALTVQVTKSLKPLQAAATSTNDSDSASQLSSAAQALSAAQQLGQFRSAVAVRLSNAQEAAAATGNGALTEAISEIKMLEAEVAGELADTRRRHKAVELGELARAAEALERAGAAAAEISCRVAAAAVAPLSADQWTALYKENDDAAAVAERIVAGVQESAPNAAKILTEAKAEFAIVASFLDQPANQTQTKTAAMYAECATSANAASEKLAAAAANLRQQQIRAAGELQAIAAEQFSVADAARQDVQKAADAIDTEAIELLEALEQARLQLVEATIEQTRAEGRTATANALLHKFQLAQLQRGQFAADRAAQAWLGGNSHNPLDAAYEQQLVADKAVEIAKTMPQQLSRLLTQAAESAREAARETINGSPPKAERARRQTLRLLREALDVADTEGKSIDTEAPGKLDGAAQGKAGEKLIATRKALELPPPISARVKEIVNLLTSAATATNQAVQQINRGDMEPVAATQRTIRESIGEASMQITSLLEALTSEQINRFREHAATSQRLIEQVGKIDPAAAADLTHAHKAAERGVESPDDPERIAQSAETTWDKTRQAAANLAVRSQALGNDRDLAQLMEQLAHQQQSARDNIAEAAEKLRQAEPGDNSPTQMASAQSLLQAQKQFAKTQLATGEGAAEVSGQVEVANQPIREGLEIASRLNQYGESEESAEKGQPGEQSGERPSSADGKAGNKKSPSNNDDQQSKNSDSQSSAASSAENSKANGQSPGEADSTELGTGLVPSTPQVTAKQIAGPEANAAAAKVAAAMKGEGKGEGAPGEGESENPGEGSPSASAKKGGGTKGGKTVANQKGADGELEKGAVEKSDNRAKGGGGDAVAGGKGSMGVEGEAWFAKLPPSVQAAIQAKSRGKAPKGYEERLRRYFDGVD